MICDTKKLEGLFDKQSHHVYMADHVAVHDSRLEQFHRLWIKIIDLEIQIVLFGVAETEG